MEGIFEQYCQPFSIALYFAMHLKEAGVKAVLTTELNASLHGLAKLLREN